MELEKAEVNPSLRPTNPLRITPTSRGLTGNRVKQGAGSDSVAATLPWHTFDRFLFICLFLALWFRSFQIASFTLIFQSPHLAQTRLPVSTSSHPLVTQIPGKRTKGPSQRPYKPSPKSGRTP